MTTRPVYRVMVQTTTSYQGDHATHWQREVLYCGTDRTEARLAYHRSTPKDSFRGFGNSRTETYVEVVEDAETDDFNDDVVDQVDLD